MNDKTLLGIIDAMSLTPGIRGCALVKTPSGEIWHRTGEIHDLDGIAKIAAECWCLHANRSKIFKSMGVPAVNILIYTEGRITLLPCGRNLILLTVTDQNPDVDWDKWQRRANNLARYIDRMQTAARSSATKNQG